MTRAHYIKKARKDIYENGKEYRTKNKKGEMVTRIDKSKPADKNDELIIAKGESYYWWQFAFRPKQISKTAPRRSQLTGSYWLGSIYDIEDMISALDIEDVQSGESCIEDIVSQMESLRDEAEERRSNMPEQLQDSGSGELLQQYYDGLDGAINDLEGIDFSEVDKEQCENEAQDEWDGLDTDMADGKKEDEWVADRAAELLDSKAQDVLDEIQAVSIEI